MHNGMRGMEGNIVKGCGELWNTSLGKNVDVKKPSFDSLMFSTAEKQSWSVLLFIAVIILSAWKQDLMEVLD